MQTKTALRKNERNVIPQMKTRFLSFLLSVLLLLSFCGCESGRKPRVVRTVEPTAVEHVWHADYYPLPENVSASGALTVSGDRVLMNGTYRPDKASSDAEDILLQFFPDTGTFSYDPLPAPADIPETAVTVCGAQLPDGGSAYVYSIPGSAGTEEYLLAVLERDGSTRFSADARALFDASAAEGMFFIADMAAAADGILYLFTRNAAAAVSAEDGHLLWQYTANGMILDRGITPDGRVFVTVPTPNGTETRYLDAEEKGLGDVLPTAEAFPAFTSDSLPAFTDGKFLLGGGYDCYYASVDGLYAANMTDTEPTLLCDWLNSDIGYYSIDTESLTVVSPERVFCLSRDPLTRKRMLCVLTPTAPEDVVPKYLIHIGTTSQNNIRYLNSCVLSFNRQSEQFRAVIDDYSGTGTELGQTAEDKLSASLVLGEKPDLLVCGAGFDYEKFEKQGLFWDLYPFLNDRTSALRKDDLLPCIPAALENKKGELPYLPQSFYVYTVFAKTDALGGKTAWTLEEFLDTAEAAPAGTCFWPTWGRAAFYELLRFSLDTFIDEKNLSCSFDSALFGRLLTFCRDLPEPVINDLDPERARSGELLLCPVSELFNSGIAEYLRYRYYGFQGAAVTPVGYPVPDGNGSVMKPEILYGITADSPVADGAWEFLCLLLTGADEENAGYASDVQFGYPATKAGLEARLTTERDLCYAFDAFSSHTAGTNGRTEEQLRAELGGMGAFAHLTEEDEAVITAMLDGITRTARAGDDAVLSMIAEDASYFFSGAKTLEETQKVIQSRVSIYISETLG